MFDFDVVTGPTPTRSQPACMTPPEQAKRPAKGHDGAHSHTERGGHPPAKERLG